jgi:fatty acid desaturase
MTAVRRRDYGLLGDDAKLAVERGLSRARWYATSLPRPQIKKLMQRRDGPAIRDTALWFALLAASGALGAHFWGSWLCVPFFLVYGVLYGSASDSRWHECGHGTAFRTRWLNDVVYQLASFMVLREPTVWRWSHTRHHTDTLIVGRDPEIAAPRPPSLLNLGLNIFALKSGTTAFYKLFLHSVGLVTSQEHTFIPESETWKVAWIARIWLAVFAAVIATCLHLHSWLPAILIGLPSFYGGFMVNFFGLTQHAGLAEDVIDHRLNTRTVYMNPVFRFLYWNMNYHLEHHMFPMVPYHALPALHEAIKQDCPAPFAGCWQAYREIVPALARQRQDPSWYVQRSIPSMASRPQTVVADRMMAGDAA